MTLECKYLPVLGIRNRRSRKSGDDQKSTMAVERNALMPAPSILGPRMQALLLFLLAALSCLGHHLFYASLNNRFAGGDILVKLRSAFHSTSSDQALANTLGTLIARVGAACMSAVIGLSFAQVFWWYMRTKSRAIRQIDTILEFKANVFNCLNWSAIPSGSWLALIALCATLTEIVTVLAPGSLTVAQLISTSPCQVSTVNISMANFAVSDIQGIITNGSNIIWPTPNGRALSLAATILMSGTYLPPSVTCTNCEYDISFIAPAVQCVNITQSADFSSLLAVAGDTPDIPLWYAGEADVDTDQTTLIVASRNVPADLQPDENLDLSLVPVVALSCTGWNATYHVTVQQNTSTSATVTDVVIGEQLQGQYYDFTAESGPNASAAAQQDQLNLLPSMQSLSLWEALIQQLSGNVTIKSEDDDDSNLLSEPMVAWSSLGRSDSAVGWSWAGNLQELIPEVMQNISLSLLAMQLSDTYTPPTQASMCTGERLSFVYNCVRLLATYGGGLGLTLVCLVFGFVAQKSNKCEETLRLSRILAAHPDFHSSPSTFLTLDTIVQVGDDGRFDPTNVV